jgi:hypothetical protein
LHLQNSKYYFRYNNILDIPQVRTSRYGKKTFKFAAATLWNSLPDHFRTKNSPGMILNVAVLHADDKYSATVFALFICI